MKPLIVTDSRPVTCWPARTAACMHTMPPWVGSQFQPKPPSGEPELSGTPPVKPGPWLDDWLSAELPRGREISTVSGPEDTEPVFATPKSTSSVLVVRVLPNCAWLMSKLALRVASVCCSDTGLACGDKGADIGTGLGTGDGVTATCEGSPTTGAAGGDAIALRGPVEPVLLLSFSTTAPDTRTTSTTPAATAMLGDSRRRACRDPVGFRRSGAALATSSPSAGVTASVTMLPATSLAPATPIPTRYASAAGPKISGATVPRRVAPMSASSPDAARHSSQPRRCSETCLASGLGSASRT